MAVERQHGKQGFASMDPEKARAIQRLGGHASHGSAHESRNGSSAAQGEKGGVAPGRTRRRSRTT